MRGDSIRDLYAKTLALIGLGLLAAVGALVDYWPVGVRPPEVAAARMPLPDVPILVQADAVRVPVAIVSEPAPRIVTRSALAMAAVYTDLPVVAGEAVWLTKPEPVAVAVVASAPAVPAFVLPVAADEPAVVAAQPGPDFDPDLVYQIAGESGDSGLLADAVDIMKSTGSTIARGGAITGTSIVSAFRAVSGAFKKLKLF